MNNSSYTVSPKEPFFQVLGTYILDGFKLAVTVGAMLIGFVALVTFLNNSFVALFNVSFTTLIGYVFAPIAWLMGVPTQDIVQAGESDGNQIDHK